MSKKDSHVIFVWLVLIVLRNFFFKLKLFCIFQNESERRQCIFGGEAYEAQ
jgi:hypothetical protein